MKELSEALAKKAIADKLRGKRDFMFRNGSEIVKITIERQDLPTIREDLTVAKADWISSGAAGTTCPKCGGSGTI